VFFVDMIRFCLGLVGVLQEPPDERHPADGLSGGQGRQSGSRALHQDPRRQRGRRTRTPPRQCSP